MAAYNEILTGRFNRMLQKLLSMKGGAAVTTLSGEIAATFSMFMGVENRYLEQWDRFASQINQGAVAGQTSSIQMRNPSNSKVVAVFEQIIFGGLVADQPFLKIFDAAGVDLGVLVNLTANRIDRRGRPNPSLIQSRATVGVPFASAQMQVFFQASSQVSLVSNENQELTLLPGDALIISSNVVNQALIASFLWRERALEESELA